MQLVTELQVVRVVRTAVEPCKGFIELRGFAGVVVREVLADRSRYITCALSQCGRQRVSVGVRRGAAVGLPLIDNAAGRVADVMVVGKEVAEPGGRYQVVGNGEIRAYVQRQIRGRISKGMRIR